MSYPFAVRMHMRCFGVPFGVPEMMLRLCRRRGYVRSLLRLRPAVKRRRTMRRYVTMSDLSLGRGMLFTPVLLGISAAAKQANRSGEACKIHFHGIR